MNESVTTSAIRVAAIRWRPFRLPMRHHFEAAHGALDDRAGVLVQLVAADGTTGLGEASPFPSLGLGTSEDVLALLEQHAADIIERGIDALPEVGPGVAALRCAVDVALVDLEAKARGVPAAHLLATAPASSVTVNAVIGGGPPQEVAGFGREAVRAGYRVVKLKVGVGTVDEDIARVTALRDACPETVIRLDANGAWDVEEALTAIAAFQTLGVELLEQPVPAADVEGLAHIREAAPLRVAADEALIDPATREQVLERKAADLLVLKPMVLGGIRPALALAERAAQAGIGAFVTTTFDSTVGTAASLHLAAALPTDAAHGLATGDHLAADVVSDPLVAASGWLAMRLAAGIGFDVDDDVLRFVATAPWSETRA